jgi:hypothetical protein
MSNINKIDIKTLWILVMDYFINEGILYKRGFSEILLRCLNEKEMKKANINVFMLHMPMCTWWYDKCKWVDTSRQ